MLHTTWTGELCLAFDATNDKCDEMHAIGVNKVLDLNNVCNINLIVQLW